MLAANHLDIIFVRLSVANRVLIRRRFLPARFFVSSGPVIPMKQLSGEEKGMKNYESTHPSK
jgi:hypothetical protein